MELNCDVLVVGGGGAGLRAAIAARESRAEMDVLLVTKGELGRSGVTATACSDRMAFHATLATTEPGGTDAWRYHADDIFRIGGHVSDADLAAILASRAGEAFEYLDRLGVPWARRADGTVDQFLTDGSLYPRACYTGPYTANHIEAALLAQARQLGVRILEQHIVGDLLLDASRQRVCGAALVAQSSDDVAVVAAKAVVLATGGAGQVFSVNVYPPDCTGDGYALAYRAGAELVNLEFIQIGLCSLATRLACSGDMMRAMPRLINDHGEEFLAHYMPSSTSTQICDVVFSKGASWPVSYNERSHVLDIAAAQELANGRRVFLDYGRDPKGMDASQLAERVHAWYARKGLDLRHPALATTPLARLEIINPQSVVWLQERGVNLRAGDRVEVAPAVQHFQGGIKIRTQADTNVPGLYAAGEAAGGQHGANRPGGNALLDTQVFGRIAGESAADYAASQPAPTMPAAREAKGLLAALLNPTGVEADGLRTTVGRAMSSECGVCRTRAGLQRLVSDLDSLLARGVSAQRAPLAKALEALNILQTARLVAGAALERDESRGPHLRFTEPGSLTPVPQDDVRWGRYIVMRKGDHGPLLESRLPMTPV